MPNTPHPIVAWLLALSGLLLACGEQPPADSTSSAPDYTEASPARAELSPGEGPSVDVSLEPVLEALQERDPLVRAARLSTLLQTLDGAAAANVRDALTDARLGLGTVESTLLLQFWANRDAKAASDWALFESPQSRRAASIEVALARWAQEDPMAAIADVVTFRRIPGPFSDVAEIALVRGWFDSGKPGLTEYMQNLSGDTAGQRALAIFAQRWAERDGVEKVLAWAESVPNDDKAYKKAALRQTGGSVALLNPLAAAAWCDRICDDELATNLRAMVAQRWASQDGPAAMEWVSRAPADLERDWAVRGAFLGWLRSDREGLERWMMVQRQGDKIDPWLQPSLQHYSGALAMNDPLKAIEWASLIEDDERRDRSLMAVAMVWRKADEEAAEAWLAESPLSEETREKVRNPQAVRNAPRTPIEEPAS